MAGAKSKKEEDVKAKAVSLLYDDMEEGGGLLNDVIVTITKAEFESTNYGGRSPSKRPAAHLVLEEEDGTVYEDQWWSCGKDTDWVPSDDGKYLIKIGAKNAISKSSNFGIFCRSLMEAGFPKDKVDADITFLEGLQFHLRQEVIADRGKTKKGDKEYDQQVAVIAEIKKFPWEKDGAKGGGKKTTAKSKTADKGGGDDDGQSAEDLLTGFLVGLLAQSPEGVKKTAIPPALIQAKNDKAADNHLDVDEKTANKMIQLAFKPEWMDSEDRPWTVEGGTVKMAG